MKEEKNSYQSLFFGFIIIGSVYLLSLIPHSVFIYLTEEDGYIEGLGALGFLLASVLFFITFSKSKSLRDSNFSSRNWIFFLLGLIFFMAFGEEISWGQRIFGWETPDELKTLNIQQETNFHNLVWFHPETEAEVKKEGFIRFFTAKWLFTYFNALYFVVIPLLYTKVKAFKHFFEGFRIPVAPLWIGLLLVFNLLLSKGVEFLFRSFTDHSEEILDLMTHGIVELMECIWALIIGLISATFLIGQSTDKSD